MRLKNKVKNLTGQKRREGKRIHSLKKFIEGEKEAIKKSHTDGERGLKTVRAYSRFVDRVVEELYLASTCEFEKNFPKKKRAKCVLIAVGGYGREELNPCSDVDILFVYEPRLDEYVESLVKDVITPLWDTGFSVGHGCRTVKESMQMGKTDLSVQTAMIESRYITGDRELYQKFDGELKKNVIDKGIDSFINRKIKEREKRHSMYDESINLLEPNIKESPGGLRDFHITMWAAATKYGTRDLKSLCKKGLISKKEMESVRESYDFLLKVRSELHFLVNKKWDILDINTQKSVAYNLGYRDRDNRKFIELFMQDYYLNAASIYRFSKMFLAKCQEKKRSRYLETKEIDTFFVSREGEIGLKNDDPSILKKNPILLLKIFSSAQKLELEVSIKTREALVSHLSSIDEEFRRSKEARDIFLSILRGDGSGEMLRLMNEIGILEKYIPEFKSIKSLIQYDSYHKYSIDEHTLKSIEILEDLSRTEKKELKELAQMFGEMPRPEIIKLALLFHDIGKGSGSDHIRRGGETAVSIMKRMEIPEDILSQVRFLIDNHLVMNHTSQRRDMHDEKTIGEFVDLIKNEENLKMLTVLTYADLNAVGPDIWTEWKATLLMELFNRAMKFMKKGGYVTGRALIDKLKEDVLLKIDPHMDKALLDDYLEKMPERYRALTSAGKIARHMQLVKKLMSKKLVIDYAHNLRIEYTDVTICTQDRRGLFSMITGTLASKNINILSAQIFTSRDNIAVDTLQVKDLKGKPILDDHMWQEFERDLLGVIEGEKNVEELILRRKKYVLPGRVKGPKADTKVIISNTISDTHSVIEVMAEDRVGLLYDITHTFFKLGLDIYLAKISTQANKAIDVFYVSDLEGNKIFHWKKMREIELELKERLSKG